MATKHIPEPTWRKVERETVKAVHHLNKAVKETEMLNLLILKGLETITPDDYEKLRK